MPRRSPPTIPSGTATRIEASVTIALSHWPKTATNRNAPAASSASRTPPRKAEQRHETPMTASQDSGGRIVERGALARGQPRQQAENSW